MARKVTKQSKHLAMRARIASQPKKAPEASKKNDSTQQATTREPLFPIVGVGASAGGLEAYTAFLKHLPTDSGMAFVLIQHLDPKQPSGLTELLSKATRMPVVEVKVDTPVEPNHVYVMAPAVSLRMSGGHIRVEDRGEGRNLPIDLFLKSLAHDRASKAIGIVLSGTASDGTIGIKAVKAEGGITFAQEPSSAKFDGMPRSAIAAGAVDFVLPPREIAKRLVRIVQHPYVAHGEGEDISESALNRIFFVLRSVTGNDFTHYKHSTIQRRIKRRMALRANEKLADYIAYLQENPGEARDLAEDLLICVTSFFREPAYFKALSTRVFPEIRKKKSAEEPIRIWVPGCATGEEAYSIAINLTEFLERSGANVPFQIFATDLSEAAIEKARTGIYPTAAIANVSPARVKQFFAKVSGGYQIGKSIRERCTFAQQNVAKDPPFHNLDLISCCNVLIYFGSVLQKKVLSTFHYALRPGGFLMLGPSENVGPLSHAFSPIDKKLKLYLKQPGSLPLNLPDRATDPLVVHVAARSAVGNLPTVLDLQRAAERLLLADYAPAGVIVDNAMNIVHVRGDTGPYLQVAAGEPNFSLLKMAREGLVAGLRTAILKAKRKKSAVNQQAQVKSGAHFRPVNLKVVPINGPVDSGPLHFMVLFEPTATSIPVGSAGREAQPPKTAARKSNNAHREILRLREELAATREYLHSIIEEQEASTEELKSANEEAQASNEELETSREELQSTNEELHTVNDELKTRNATLADLNSDLTNVLASINVPLVMVGKDLKIRRFTPSMEPMLNFIDSDIGRSISDLKPNIDVPDLPDLLRAVVTSGKPSAAQETQAPDGTWYSLQALPYRAPDHKTDGAVLVMLDVNAVKRSRDFAEAVAETVREPLIILTKELKVRSANRAFYETFKVSRADTEDHFLYDLGNGQWNIPKLRELLEKILPQNGVLKDFEVEHTFLNIGQKTMLLNAREIRQESPFGGPTILLAIEDITMPKRLLSHSLNEAEDARKEALDLKRRLVLAGDGLKIGTWEMDLATSDITGSERWAELYGSKAQEGFNAAGLLDRVHSDDRATSEADLQQMISTGKSINGEYHVVWPDGSSHWLNHRAELIRDAEGKAVRIRGVSIDVTEQKLLALERQALAARVTMAQEGERRRIARELHDGLVQDLAALAMDLGRRVTQPSATAALKKDSQDLQHRVIKAAEAARQVAYQLHPTELDDLGLQTALKAYCEQVSRETGLKVKFRAGKVPADLDRNIASCLYKVAQEALRNVVKHSNANSAKVAIDVTGNKIRLQIEDSGKGFQLSKLQLSAGLGVASMRERVQLVNGKFTFYSRPGKGTQVLSEVPLVSRGS